MKITCTKSDLKNALDSVRRAIAARPTHPVLACVKLVAYPDSQLVEVCGFDLNLSIECVFSAKISEAGKLAIPANLFREMVAKLPDGDVTLTLDGETLKIKCGRVKYQIQILQDEYPEIPVPEESQVIELPCEVLARGLARTTICASEDPSKQVLQGVRFTLGGDKLELTATDGYCLAVSEHLLEGDFPKIETTIPASNLQELARTLKDKEAVRLTLGGNLVQFQIGDFKLGCRTLEGQYPACQKLIPKQFEQVFTCDRVQLVEAIERQLVVTPKGKKVCEFLLSKTEMRLRSETADVGESEETLPIQLTGEGLELGLNHDYLLKGLRAMRSQDVRFSLNTPTSPVIVEPLGEAKLTFLVMPVQIRGR